jgi:hypothetical protein
MGFKFSKHYHNTKPLKGGNTGHDKDFINSRRTKCLYGL